MCIFLFMESQGYIIIKTYYSEITKVRLKWIIMGINHALLTQGTLIYKFFVKDTVGSVNMSIVYCSTVHMLADFFTKYYL